MVYYSTKSDRYKETTNCQVNNHTYINSGDRCALLYFFNDYNWRRRNMLKLFESIIYIYLVYIYALIHIKTRSQRHFLKRIFFFTIEFLRGNKLWGVVIDIHNINSHNPYKQVNKIL